MRGIIYKTCTDYLGQIGDYHVWKDTCTNTYQVTKDNPEDDIRPPEGSWGYYNLDSLLSLKGFSKAQIKAYKAKYKVED